MTTQNKVYPGRVIRIEAGTFVRREGSLSKRKEDTFVTVRRIEPARAGKTRIYWKSHGYLASALI